MRALFCFALLLPGPALAEVILATSTITSVTVYPQGAEVVREVRFTAAAGQHELLITDLPAATLPDLLRLSPAAGVQVGAYALRRDRLPPREAVQSPAQALALADVERLEVVERTALAVIAGINAQVEAAEAQADFLRGVKAEGDAVTAEGLRGIAAMIGTEVLAARQAALAAQAALPAAEQALSEAQENLAQAHEAFDALSGLDEDYAALSIALSIAEATGEGAGHLTLSHFIADAAWRPVYDLKLSRKDPSLTMARGVLVSQYSGEDWAGVTLTLSTAQPSAQAAPSGLWPDLRRIAPPMPDSDAVAETAVSAAPESGAVTSDKFASVAAAEMQGDVVVYRYPVPVDVASGVEDLRLALDELSFVPKVEARAVPRYDRTAFVLASFTNTTAEILLPGEAFLLREGTLVGSTMLDILSPGAEAEVAFGAIDGLRLTRDMPQRIEGDQGILSSSSLLEETAVLEVENLTGESWPVRLLDQVPYSEQEDLEISFSADPEPSEIDVDGQRGILAWEFDIAPGETRKVRLDHVLKWPEEMELQ